MSIIGMGLASGSITIFSGDRLGVQSGMGLYNPISISSGGISSGQLGFIPQSGFGWKCAICNCHVTEQDGYHAGRQIKYITIYDPEQGINQWVRRLCLSCAGYREDLGRLENREDWIRETIPLESGTPAQIVADYLQDQSRYKDSDYMREVAERNLRMSGG